MAVHAKGFNLGDLLVAVNVLEEWSVSGGGGIMVLLLVEEGSVVDGICESEIGGVVALCHGGDRWLWLVIRNTEDKRKKKK